MEGCRRLSFCTCADHFPGFVSDRPDELRGRAGRWRRWNWSSRWRGRGIGGRLGWASGAPPIRSPQAPGSGCCCDSCTPDNSRRASKACGGGTAGGARSGARCAVGEHSAIDDRGYGRCRHRFHRHRRCWSGKRRGNRIWCGHGHRVRERAGNRRRPGRQLSANADPVLPAAVARASVAAWVSPHGILRRRRERQFEAARLQPFPGWWLQSPAAGGAAGVALSAWSDSWRDASAGYCRYSVHLLMRTSGANG